MKYIGDLITRGHLEDLAATDARAREVLDELDRRGGGCAVRTVGGDFFALNDDDDLQAPDPET